MCADLRLIEAILPAKAPSEGPAACRRCVARERRGDKAMAECPRLQQLLTSVAPSSAMPDQAD